MKVVVYNPLVAVWRPRLPAMLSVVQELIDAGDDVVYIGCDRKVPACTANLEHGKAICGYCVTRGKRGLALLSGNYTAGMLADYIDAATMAALKESVDEFETLDELRKLHYRGMDVGYAALSSYAHVARNSEPDLSNPLIKAVIQNLLRTGKIVYEAITAALDREKPDRVIIYHGRSAIDRAALRACDAKGIECHVYETALGVNKLIYFKNALPQDIENFGRVVNEFWDAGSSDKHTIGKQFFEMRSQGSMAADSGDVTITTQDKVYIRKQEAGALPATWNDQCRNVVVYGSSDDEFVAISPEYESPIYPDQVEAVRQIANSLMNDPMTRVYFRIHPRQKGVDNAFIRALKALDATCFNLTVIGAESKISSYALLEHADTVLSFRSTMSIEAVYWGKPSIVLSSSIFKPLGATYNPVDHDEVIELARTDLPPKDRTPALKMGYFRLRSGFSHPYYEGDIRKGSRGYAFNGSSITAGRLERLIYFIAREFQRLKWRSMA